MRKYEILHSDISLENEEKILSRRELEILILVAAGFENLQIAKVFKVTLSTVKKQLEKIFVKLKAKNRANAVFIGQCQGLISQKDYETVINCPAIKEFINTCKYFRN